jgi:intein-encoded DNA endonuclease-like protein
MAKRGRKPTVHTPELQKKFMDQCKDVFTYEEAREFVVTNLRLDYVKAIKQFEYKATQSFLSGFKEQDGTRSILGTADDARKYVVVARTEDIALLDAIRKQLAKKKDGYNKNLQKISEKIFNLKYQIRLFDRDGADGVALAAPLEEAAGGQFLTYK